MAEIQTIFPTANPGASSGNAVAPPLANVPGQFPPILASAVVPIAKAVQDFGGNPTGRKSEFCFPVNTPAGQAERREADAKRKQLRRHGARMVEPAPLPSAVAGPNGELSPSGDVVGTGSSGASTPGIVAGPPVIPWTAELVKEFTDEIISALEENRQTKISGLAREAGLPDKVVKKIHDDCRYPAGSKKGLQMATPKVVARVMNRSGVSGEHADTLVLLGSMAMIWKQGSALKRDVVELIEAHNKTKAIVLRPATETLL